MANRDSQTSAQKDNPKRFDQARPFPFEVASLPDHLDALGDAFKAFRWGLATRHFTGARVDERVFQVRTMVEALQGELNKLHDPMNFGDVGAVLDVPCVYDKTYHLQGLLFLLDEGLCSINLAGDIGFPSEGLDHQGIERLFKLVCNAFGDLRSMIAKEMQSNSSGADRAH